MEFRILGPLEVVDAGRVVELGKGKQRVVLAALLLHANEFVSAERLVSVVWGDRPPSTARTALHGHVHRLRKLLGPDRIETLAAGYVLRVAEGELDRDRFERLLAGGCVHDAMALWRGPALADFAHEPFARGEIDRLEDIRVAGREQRVEADLEAGRPVVGELEALVREHPLRERFRAQLMLALYRSGRQAEALEAYQATRETLVDELGIEPGKELKELQRRILAQDPQLGPAPAAPPREPYRGEQRKTVTILFCSVVGRLDPESERHEDAVARVLTRNGATIDRVVGGATMAVFGVPRLHEDDPLRALRTAVELQEHLARLDLDVTAGVATGEVVASGTEVRGDAVDLAARLHHWAGQGEILFGDATMRLVRDAAVAEPVELPQRGAEPVAAWLLEELRAGAPAFARRLDTPLVDRHDELEQLRQAFRRAERERECVLFTLFGPAGIGKTRLASELAASIGEATVATGRCLSYGEGITYRPLAEIVRELAGDDLRGFAQSVLTDDEDADLIVELVTSAIGLGEPPAGSDEIFWSIRKLLEAAARERPLVLVLEDLHWAEQTLLDLIDHLADFARSAPILLLCIARPDLLDRRPGWGGGKLNAGSLLLKPLTDADAQALIDRLSATASLAPDHRARVAAAAEGNPLFLEQMLATLVLDASEPESVPTIQALLATRLDQLSGEERSVLGMAAVVGTEFPPAGLAELLPDEDAVTVRRILQTLTRKELVRPEGARFRFRHGLIRDAAYHSLPKTERAAQHRRLASWLESRESHGVADRDELLGHHLEQAYRLAAQVGPVEEQDHDLAVRAGAHLGSAGRRALARGDMPAAANLLGRAAALLPARDPSRIELLPDLARSLTLLGEIERAETVLTEAVEAAAAAGDPRVEADAAMDRELLRFYRRGTRGSLSGLLDAAQRAVAVFEELGDDLGLCRAWRKTAFSHMVMCRYEPCRVASERAFAHARRAGSSIDELFIMNTLGFVYVDGPTPVEDGIARIEELLPSARKYPSCEANLLTCVAALYAMDGELGEARSLYRRADQIVAELGRHGHMAQAAFNMGRAELLAGDTPAAVQHLRRGYDLLKDHAGKAFFATVGAYLASATYEADLFDEAERVVRASEQAAPADDVMTQIKLKATRAKLLARRGSIRRAKILARQAVDLAAATDSLNEQASARVDLCQVLALSGEPDAAPPLLREAASLYGQKGNRVSAARVAEVLSTHV